MTDPGRCDVAVICGGPAGIAAALAATACGARTALFERESRLGGNATHALVHTICGLYALDAGAAPRCLHPGLPGKLAAALGRAGGAGDPVAAGRVHYLPIRPPVFAALAGQACAKAAGLEVHTSTPLLGVRLAREADEASRLEVGGAGGGRRVEARVVVDTSGESVAACLGGAESEMSERALLQRPSFIFRLEDVDAEGLEGFARIRLTTSVARAAHTGRLPADCESLVVRPDTLPGSVYATLTVPPLAGRAYDPLDPAYLEDLRVHARRAAEQVLEFLRAGRPGFARAKVADWPARIGIRETRRIVGRERLTREDVLTGRLRPDEVARSSWPIELWEDHRRPRWELPDGPCSVPLGALVSRSHPRLGAAGRCLSASHEALGALRVIGTALATGEAIGVAAALAADAGTSLDRVSSDAVRERIATLEIGLP